MYNPRFPHRLRVWRNRMDENGLPIADENGDPLKEVLMLHKVQMIDNTPITAMDGAYETEEVEWIEFGYRTSSKSTRDSADVYVSDHMISLPLFITFLNPGDLLEIEDYDRTYWAEVVKKHTFNLGSNIWFKEVNN